MDSHTAISECKLTGKKRSEEGYVDTRLDTTNPPNRFIKFGEVAAIHRINSCKNLVMDENMINEVLSFRFESNTIALAC